MANYSAGWTKSPSKKQVITFFSLWLIGSLLLLIAMTNFFTENPLKSKKLQLCWLQIIATFSMIRIWFNYLKVKRHMDT
jgi:hypothetical protein